MARNSTAIDQGMNGFLKNSTGLVLVSTVVWMLDWGNVLVHQCFTPGRGVMIQYHHDTIDRYGNTWGMTHDTAL